MVVWANSEQQDSGYLETPTGTFSVDSYALTSPRLDTVGDRGHPPAVAVDLQAGFHSDLLGPLAIGLLTGGGVLLLLGVLLVVAGAIGLGRQGPPPSRGPGMPAEPATGLAGPGPVTAEDTRPYPARLHGELDPGLSRWMWLVKWFLAIPHVIVLFFLWFAFAVTTIVAGFAILFTGRHPRAIFNFNVGSLAEDGPW